MTERPVAVLGGGPAGMSAALWLKNYGIEPLLIDRAREPGGLQRISDYPNSTLLGFRGMTAPQIAREFVEHMELERVAVLEGFARAIDLEPEGVAVRIEGREPMRFSAVVLAVGTRWRRLDVPGAPEAENRRQLRYLGVGSNVEDALGRRVAVIGGGDNAYSAALELAGYAERVFILSRAAPRAQRLLAARVAAQPKIEVRAGDRVRAFAPGVLELEGSGGQSVLEATLAFATLGFVPNTEHLAKALPSLALDANGYILVDADCRTSVQRIWAAGDVCNPLHPCTATAVALGTMAARNIEQTLRSPDAIRRWELRALPLPPARAV